MSWSTARRWVAAACVAAGLAAGAPANSASALPTGLEALKRYCVTTDARHAEALSAVEADGFAAMPEGSDPPPLAHPDARIAPGGEAVMAVGEMDSPKKIKGFHLSACLVAFKEAGDAAKINLSVRRWLGLDAYERWTGGSFYLFEQGSAGPRSLETATDEELRRLSAEGRVRVVSIDADEKATVLVYGVMTADPPPAVPAAAPVSTPFDDFKALCLEHRGQPEESLKAADASGWMQMPPQMRRDFPYPVVSGAFRLKSTEEDFEALIAGQGRFQLNLQRLSFNVCGLLQAPPADRTLVAAVQDWVGMEPVDTFPGGSKLFLFVEEGGKRRSLAGPNIDAALARAARTGAVSIVIADQGSSTSAEAFVAYGVITKVVAVDAGSAAYARR